MGLKIQKQSIVMQNLIIFLLLSIFFTHAVDSMISGISAFSFTRFKYTILNNFELVTMIFIGILSITWAKKISFIFVIGTFSWIFIYLGQIYLIGFDKRVLLLFFFYLIFSTVFLFSWFIELQEAQYHPSYSKRDLGSIFQNNLEVRVIQNNGTVLNGFLTNWSTKGCFIAFDNDISKLKGLVQLELQFEDKSFSAELDIISSYYRV